MTAFVHRTWAMLLLGIGIGTWIAFEATSLYEYAYDLYDRAYPILRTEVQVARYDREVLTLDAVFHKRRDCDRVQFYAYVQAADGTSRRANMTRADMMSPPVYLEEGQSMSAEVVVYPVPRDSVKVSLKGVYKCGSSHLVIADLWSGSLDLSHGQ